MKTGDVVKYKFPLDADEAEEHYILLEDPSDTPRPDCALLGWKGPIIPCKRIPIEDLELADPDCAEPEARSKTMTRRKKK